MDNRIPHTLDARVWADDWLKTIAKHPDIPQDRGCMIGWFANAIMAGYDEAIRRAEQRHKEDDAKRTTRSQR